MSSPAMNLSRFDSDSPRAIRIWLLASSTIASMFR
jgi:hypothetical protein